MAPATKKYRRKTTGTRPSPNAKQLANLKPAKPGEVRNPLGINGQRPYSQAMKKMSDEPMPEVLRAMLNDQVRILLGKKKMEDLFSPGISWSDANALRRHIKAVVDGDTRDAVEIREAVEGRATQRIEFSGGNDRLKMLVEALKVKRENPPPIPPPVPSAQP
jgi:hypothetical protein